MKSFSRSVSVLVLCAGFLLPAAVMAQAAMTVLTNLGANAEQTSYVTSLVESHSLEIHEVEAVGSVASNAQDLVQLLTAWVGLKNSYSYHANDLATVLPQLVEMANGDSARLPGLMERLAYLRTIGISKQAAMPVLKEEIATQYEAAQDATRQAAGKDFLGFNWGLGIATVFDVDGGSRVSEASVVDGIVRVDKEDNNTVRVVAEVHRLFRYKKDRGKSFDQVRSGYGPFVGIQSSSKQVIDSFSVGVLFAWRMPKDSSSALGFGIGVVIDPAARVLGDGIKENQPLPGAETAVRFKRVDRIGVSLMTTFSF